MSTVAPLKTPRFKRARLVSQGPDRRAGTLFRADGAGIGGVTLQSTEAAAVAAVRTGYRVAEAQIERLRKVGERVRSAGEQVAGNEAERRAVDHTEQLINQSILTGLAWVEGLAAEPGSPLQRLVAAQYRLLGGALGIDAARRAPITAPQTPAAPPPATPPPTPTQRGVDLAETMRRRKLRLAIVHKGEVRRRVVLREVDLNFLQMKTDPLDPLLFFHEKQLDAEPIAAQLSIGPARLEVHLKQTSPPGAWSAAICDASGLQHGWIEIEV